MIELIEVGKVYNKKGMTICALDSISLTIKKGESICILGKSGSGKSTLLDVIASLIKPTSGRYYYNRRLVSELTPNNLSQFRNENMGFVFQSFNLIPSLTVIENILLPLKYRKHQSPKDNINNNLSLLELQHLLNRYPDELSGGQQQRVAIARALATEPQCIIADEPTGNLDSTNSEVVMNILFNLKEKGTTLILVTHDQDLSKRFDRIITLKDGKIVEEL